MGEVPFIGVPPTTTEKQAFLKGLQDLCPKAAILSIFFQKEEQDKHPSSMKLPRTIDSFYHPRYSKLSAAMLQEESCKVFEEIKITEEESQYLAKCTRLQSQSTTWFSHRKGRITASRFRAACKTSVVKPAESLVRQILQQTTPPKSASLSWGLENEEKVRQLYVEMMSSMHAEFEVETTGLHVNPKYPYLGASPDGLVTCACCGNGLLEVKCPYSVRQSPPTCAAYLHAAENGGYSLSRDHEYYFQIQGQMGITERPYCDFVCWTLVGIHRERIKYDPVFFLGWMPSCAASFFL